MTDAASTNNRPTPAADWKAAHRTLVTLPSGRHVRIRKLTGEFILVIRDLFESLLESGESSKTLRLDLDQQRKYIHALVLESVLEPKVVPDTIPAGEDAMHVADFGPDLDSLVAAIQAYNGEILQLPFRAEAVRDVASPVGEDVLAPAVGVPEDAAPGVVIERVGDDAGSAS